MDEQFMYDSLSEIAEALGDCNSNPISASLLCLRHGLTFEDKGKIVVAFNSVLREKSFDDLSVDLFGQAFEKVVLKAKEYADVVVIAFIKAFARNYIVELVPFSRTL